jgi:hypothetical protein
MFTLWIGDPDEEDVEKLDDVTLGGEPDVFRAFKTITNMFAQKYSLLDGLPYPDLLMVPTYHMTDVTLTPDEFRRIQEQGRAFLAQEKPQDDLVLDVLDTLIHAQLPIWSGGRKDANIEGGGCSY